MESNRIPFNSTQLLKFPVVSFDVETTGLKWKTDTMFGFSVAGYDPEQHTIMSEYWDVRDNPSSLKFLNDLLKCGRRIVNHNIKFDAHFALSAGVNVKLDKLECTSVRAALINEWESSFSLDALAFKYLGHHKVDIYQELADMFGGKPTRNVQMANLHKAPASMVGPYAKVDAELAAMLWHWQDEQIHKQSLINVWTLERNLLPIIIGMERNGVRVDEDRAFNSLYDLNKQVLGLQADLDNMSGGKTNYGSPKQMRELFEVFQDSEGKWHGGGVELDLTDKGAPSINAEALKRMAAVGDPLAQNILKLRKFTKCASFLKDHIIGHAIDGRVYPSYNQCRSENGLGTGTGRFSISDPALQQIPARDGEISEITRSCFVPEPKSSWLRLDYSQFEVRVFAHYVNDANLNKKYQEDPDTDLHQAVADLTGLPRSATGDSGGANAKQINLGLIFGEGEGTMAAEMKLPYTVVDGRKVAGSKAKEIFRKYHNSIPGIKRLLNDSSRIAKSRGYVRTIMGRHLRFPGGKFTHKAGGLVFQGSAADSMKVKMIEMHKMAQQYGFQMLLSVHDELDFSIPNDIKSERLTKEIVNAYTNYHSPWAAVNFRIPITCSYAYGPNWFAAKDK